MDPIDPNLRIASVRLAVSDLPASVEFYSRAMGLGVLENDGRRAILGAGGQPSLELTALDRPGPVPPRSTGLFHVAWLHPTRASLADTVRRIGRTRWPFTGASDHGVSEALYLDDPDGLGIEIYADRPREAWEPGRDGQRIRMVTLPLDVEDLLAQSEEPGAEIDGGTGIGHVHLKVADVPRADSFYRALGFEDQALLPAAAFVSAGGYHHHLGLNSWQSAGGRPAGEHAPGLRHIAFELADEDAVNAVANAAEQIEGAGARRDDDERVELSDPDGHSLSFRVR
jgi:catechol 2,3-dioxygenase